MAMTSPTDFHLGGQGRSREFLEGKTRHLGDDVVDRRLERRRVAPPVMSLASSSRV